MENENQLYIEDFDSVISRSPNRQIKVVCPLCRDRRTNKADRALSINTSTLEYHCHYCDAKGVLKSRNESHNYNNDDRYYNPKKRYYKRPENKNVSTIEYSETFLEYFKGRGISEKTLKKVGITQEVEYFPQLQKKSGCIAFNYFLNGELVNTKFRTRNKDFKLVSGAELILYNIDSINPKKYKDGEEKYAIITEGECFDEKAQILTENGWKLFSELNEGEKVAQYDNGAISFVEPLNRIAKHYNGDLIEYSNRKNNYYSLTTPKHNLVAEKNDELYKIHAEDISCQISIPRNGRINGNGIDLTDDQIRLYCALSADFTFRKAGDIYGCLKKQRKYERIKMLLDNLNLRYSINKDSRDYYSVYIHRGQNIVANKDFDMSWIGKLSAHQIDVILEEIVLWDGNSVKGRTMKEYNSNRMNNIIFIQTLCHLSNKCSTICKRSNKYGTWYKCTILKKHNSSISSKYRKNISYNGMVYCVSVPSGMILVRQNNIITVTGNCDCITYTECGYTHVVSVPNGANKNLEYLDNYIDDFIEPLDIIYISSDNDNKGVELKNELLRRFGEEKCRIINYPEPCKDINEVLVKYGKDTVRKCFEEYTEIKPEGVKELVDVESSLDYLFNHGFEAGDKVGIPSLDEIISFKVGMLCIVTGIPGHGKTFMLNFLLGRLNILHDWKIAFFSPEFYPIQDHIGQMIETFGGKRFTSKNYNLQEYELMKDYVTRNLFWIDPDDTDINSVMERAKYLIKKKGIKALVIDPFNSLTDNTKKNVKQDEYIADFLQKMRWFARKYGVAVFLVMHPTKKQKLENGLYPVCDLYDCKGASEVNDKADIGITAWRNKDEDYNEIHITKIKFRHLGRLDYATFKFNINNGRYTPIEKVEILKKQGIDTKTMQVDWDNSNWIIDKIKGRQVSEPIVFPQPNDDFLTDSSTDCPF